jgi:hypothetical protein
VGLFQQRAAADGNFNKFKLKSFSAALLATTERAARSAVAGKEISHDTENCCSCPRRAWRCCSHLDCGFRNTKRDPECERGRRANLRYPAGALGSGPARPRRVASGSALPRRCRSAPLLASGMASRLRLWSKAGVGSAASVGRHFRLGYRPGLGCWASLERRTRLGCGASLGRAPGMGLERRLVVIPAAGTWPFADEALARSS